MAPPSSQTLRRVGPLLVAAGLVGATGSCFFTLNDVVADQEAGSGGTAGAPPSCPEGSLPVVTDAAAGAAGCRAIDDLPTAGMALWLNAREGLELAPDSVTGGLNVLSWQDQSGRGVVGRSGDGARPVRVEVDGQPWISFNHLLANSTRQSLLLTTMKLDPSRGFTGFVVARTSEVIDKVASADVVRYPMLFELGTERNVCGLDACSKLYLSRLIPKRDVVDGKPVGDGQGILTMSWYTPTSQRWFQATDPQVVRVDRSVAVGFRVDAAGTPTLYANGAALALEPVAGNSSSVSLPLPGPGDYREGHVGNSTRESEPYFGELAEVLFYERPLSDAEVARVFVHLSSSWKLTP